MKRRSDFSSMDMLLDTMCNTFGGVCFIALMVSILSAAVPKTESDTTSVARVSEADLLAREKAKLVKRRDELKTLIEIQNDFVIRSSTGVVVRADLLRIAGEVSANDEQIRLYEKKRLEYLDELAKLKTSASYSKREAARLARLLKNLEDQAGGPLFDRHRVVRMPRERQEEDMRPFDVWLYGRRMYVVRDPKYTRCEVLNEHAWRYFPLPNAGLILNEDFFAESSVWASMVRQIGSRTYVRIFSDTTSFNELCLLRDALINKGSKYNWIVWEHPDLRFVEGYDGTVQ